jgi:hypothetical protein
LRRLSLSVLLVAIFLLPVGIGSGTSAHSHAVAALDGALANTASAQAQVLEDYFERARSIDLLTANNPAFQDFYELSGSRVAKVRRGGPVLNKTNRALGYLEELFPDSIGEALGEPEPLDAGELEPGGADSAQGVAAGVAAAHQGGPDQVGQPLDSRQARGVGLDVFEEAQLPAGPQHPGELGHARA